jgi:hypothetical protein
VKRFPLQVIARLVAASALLAATFVAPAAGHVGLGVAARRTGAAQAPRVGREFKLKAGRAVTFGREGLRVRFARVASDSRCPVNVDCVWAGSAEVLIEVGAKGGRAKQTLRLNTNAGGPGAGEGKYGRYTVKLVGLSPQPRAGRKIAAGQYTATLLVTLTIVD